MNCAKYSRVAVILEEGIADGGSTEFTEVRAAHFGALGNRALPVTDPFPLSPRIGPVSELSSVEQHQCAGFLSADARRLQRGLQGRILGARVEKHSPGLERKNIALE